MGFEPTHLEPFTIGGQRVGNQFKKLPCGIEGIIDPAL
jgi:hypothetical protein